jgi:cell division protein FtsL
LAERKHSAAFPLVQLALILAATLVVYLAVDFGRQVVLSHQRRDELRQVEDKITAAAQKRTDLEKRLEYVRSPQAAQEWAREQGWVLANEVPVVLVAPKSAQGSAEPAHTQGESDPASNRSRWWYLFFGGR